MRLGELVRGLHPAPDVGAAAGVEVTGVAYDSRRVKAGDLFVAVVGTVSDGHAFAADAARRGARAVAVQAGWPAAREAAAAATAAGAAAFAVDDARRALALLSARFHGYPALRLRLIGITGTNGKTTSTYLVRAALRQAGRRAGLIGTVQNFVVDEPRPVEHTTPESADLQALLAEMVAGGAGAAVMEVSSHALAMGRVVGCPFAAALFTNLTPEHLDYHKTMRSYAKAKRILFEGLAPDAVAVAGADAAWARTIVRGTRARQLWFGIRRAADVRAENVGSDVRGSRFTLATPRGRVEVYTELPGTYNIYNCLAAAAVAEGLDMPLEAIAQGIEDVKTIRGRLEPVPTGLPLTVLVDYAHKTEALKQVLSTVRKLVTKPGRLMVVFGCGGNRDREKRPAMGKVAQRLADRVFVTSDNPRNEKPDEIIKEIVSGFTSMKKVTVEADRRAAIGLALRQARAGDVVIIAGKGHETYQITCDVKRPFDDGRIAAEVLRDIEAGACVKCTI